MAIQVEIPFRRSKKGIVIGVRVEPRASAAVIAGVMENGVLKVRLTAPPEGGEANTQLVELLAKATGIAKSRIRIIRGMSSKNKVVELEGISVSDDFVPVQVKYLRKGGMPRKQDESTG